MSYTGILMKKFKISFLQQTVSIFVLFFALAAHNTAKAEMDIRLHGK